MAILKPKSMENTRKNVRKTQKQQPTYY